MARSVCVPRAIPGLAYAKQSIIIYMYIYKFIAFFFEEPAVHKSFLLPAWDESL